MSGTIYQMDDNHTCIIIPSIQYEHAVVDETPQRSWKSLKVNNRILLQKVSCLYELFFSPSSIFKCSTNQHAPDS